MPCDETFDISHMFDLLRQVKTMDVAGFVCNLLQIFEIKIKSTLVKFTFQFKSWLRIMMLEMIVYS